MVRNDAFVGDNDEHFSDEKYMFEELDCSLKSDTAQEIARDWIEKVTDSLFPSTNFLESLKDGILLCNLIKRIQPELIHDVIESPSPQESLVNVTKFLKGCLVLGLSEWQLFDPEEFSSTEPQSPLEDEVVQKVISTLYWLGCIVKGMSYYGGPILDVSQFHRDADGIISVKQRNGVSHNSGGERSLMQPPDYNTRHHPTRLNGSVPQANGIPSHLMNGYGDVWPEQESQEEFSVNVRILGDEKRFGFSVMGGVDEGFPPRIDDISEGSPAAKAGLRVGDEILEVNGQPLHDATHTDVILSIHKCLKNRVIALKLRRSGGYSFPGGQSESDGSIVGQNGIKHGQVERNTRNKLEKIITDQENDPQFQYYNSEGESEQSNGENGVQDYDYLENNEENKASNLNGSMWDNNNRSNDSRGVNGKNLMQSNLQKHKSLSTPLFDLTKLDAVDVDIDEEGIENIGRDSDSDSENNVPDEASEEVLFPIVQELKPKLETGYERERLSFVEELLEKQEYQNAAKVYTTIIEQERSGRAPYSTKPTTTTALQCSAELKDSLLDVPDSQEAIELLKLLRSPKVEGLLFAHDRLASREVLPDDVDEVNEIEEDPYQVVDQQRSPDEPWSPIEDDTVKIVRIDKASDPLGATVKNEHGAVVIGRIVKGGAADKSGLLHENDEILEINGVNMKGKTVAEVCELLADMNGTLTFLLIPANRSNRVSDREVHVKAHFDYDPYEDDLIPCRELGLAFRRGDILHVVNQEDPHWWQAWRAGEEAGKQLAGLIPSRQFQQQRESMKTSAREKEPTQKEKRFCLCFKRKRRKKVLYNAQRNEEYDMDEVLSYEEVGLMQPDPARKKRPVVLIGPTKIGRKELRQRLIHFSQDRFSGAIPHTSRPMKPGEENGLDYFFVPRSAFEADIVTHKFVEHGELQNHYYGTSLDSIRMVVNAGKTCILNLSCEALKTLKASDLKPYVIFISPPSYDRIRTLRRGRVDPFNPKLTETMNDGELHDMVNKAREMEDTFGHYFDYTIVNTDFERTFDELRQTIEKLESEAQWVPVSWIR